MIKGRGHQAAGRGLDSQDRATKMGSEALEGEIIQQDVLALPQRQQGGQNGVPQAISLLIEGLDDVRTGYAGFTTWSFSPLRNASSVAMAIRSMFSPASRVL